MDNMTALVSAFARAYHYRNNHTWVFADPIAEKMLTDEEYTAISQNMSQGISFFAPEFRGTQEEALRYIVDHQLAPSVLARSAFCERAIENTVRIGCEAVNRYIHGGEGTAKEAAAAIGFAIYRTGEMENLISWMRSYNVTAADGDDIRFYGFDMQQTEYNGRVSGPYPKDLQLHRHIRYRESPASEYKRH